MLPTSNLVLFNSSKLIYQQKLIVLIQLTDYSLHIKIHKISRTPLHATILQPHLSARFSTPKAYPSTSSTPVCSYKYHTRSHSFNRNNPPPKPSTQLNPQKHHSSQSPSLVQPPRKPPQHTPYDTEYAIDAPPSTCRLQLYMYLRNCTSPQLATTSFFPPH